MMSRCSDRVRRRRGARTPQRGTADRRSGDHRFCVGGLGKLHPQGGRLERFVTPRSLAEAITPKQRPRRCVAARQRAAAVRCVGSPRTAQWRENHPEGVHMYRHILVPIDLGRPSSTSPRSIPRVMMAKLSDATIRLINVLPMTPVLLAEYVPPDFEVQQRKAADEALAAVARRPDWSRRGSRRRCVRAASTRRFSKKRTASRPT